MSVSALALQFDVIIFINTRIVSPNGNTQPKIWASMMTDSVSTLSPLSISISNWYLHSFCSVFDGMFNKYSEVTTLGQPQYSAVVEKYEVVDICNNIRRLFVIPKRYTPILSVHFQSILLYLARNSSKTVHTMSNHCGLTALHCPGHAILVMTEPDTILTESVSSERIKHQPLLLLSWPKDYFSHQKCINK